MELEFDAGDCLVLLSDGIYEHADAKGEQFGRQRVEQVLWADQQDSAAALAALLMNAVQVHGWRPIRTRVPC